MKKEIQIDIIGYEGLYQVSNYRRVKSLERKVRTGKGARTVKEKIFKSNVNVRLSKNNKQRIYNVNRLVEIHFI